MAGIFTIREQSSIWAAARPLCHATMIDSCWIVKLFNLSQSVSWYHLDHTSPRKPITIMSRVTCLSTLLLASAATISAEEDYMESPSDPRLFFGNVTASENKWHKRVGKCLICVVIDLLPVNVTLAAYGAAIIVGGSILGLLIYFLATQVRTKTCLWYEQLLIAV